ncbi:MAG: FG-GAP-like repeat-containing protein [Bifidobacteriaceae bacterium]|jgi:uncharacterized protein YkwD|nr:FG-GAP-like repeat-containing protein [Bifidobacteriaceae bacterium]
MVLKNRCKAATLTLAALLLVLPTVELPHPALGTEMPPGAATNSAGEGLGAGADGSGQSEASQPAPDGYDDGYGYGDAQAQLGEPVAATDAPTPGEPAEPAEPGVGTDADGTGQTEAGEPGDVSANSPLGVTPAAVGVIDTSNQEAVAAAYLDVLAAALAVPITWTGAVSGCKPGTINAAAQAATFDAVNFYRRMAGLQPITENTTASAIAQRTALMMVAKGALSHNPTPDWPCYTNNGAFMAARSNLAWGSGASNGAGAAAVVLYIHDSGTNAATVGHRRWLLSAGQGTMGSGSTAGSSGSSNVLVWGNTTGTANSLTWNTAESPAFSATYNTAWSSPNFVTWPSAGYFPYQLAADQVSGKLPWSVTLGRASASFASASVAVKKNGATVGTTVLSRDTLGYGDRGALIFQLADAVMTQPAPGTADIYDVSVTGITGSPTSLSYQVKVFAIPQVAISGVNLTGDFRVDGLMTPQVVGLSPSNATLTYQWLRDWTAISGATGSTYKPTAADIGHYVAVRVTASRPGYTATSFTSSGWQVYEGSFSTVNLGSCTTPTVGVTCTPGDSTTVSGATRTYQWRLGSSAVGGSRGTAASFTPAAADVGQVLSYSVTFAKTGYQSRTVSQTLGTIIASSQPPSLPTAVFTQVVLAPDMTGDGRGEVVGLHNDGRVLLYPFSASGTLGSAIVAGTGFGNYRLFAPGDWSGDGIPDLAGINTNGELLLFNGLKGGKLRGSRQIGHGWTNYRVIPAGDLNGDKYPDLLAIDKKGVLWIYPWRGSAFGQRKQVGHGWLGWELHAAGDLNNDGKMDILGIKPTGELFRYFGKGNGGFMPAVQIGHGWGTYELSAGADLSGDKLADIVGLNLNTRALYYYKGRGGGSFTTPKQIASGW